MPASAPAPHEPGAQAADETEPATELAIAAGKAADKLSVVERGIMSENPLPREVVRQISNILDEWDVRGDPAWGMRQVRHQMLYYVRFLNRTYGHMFAAQYPRENQPPVRPPESTRWVEARIFRSCQTVFFEGVRRALMESSGETIVKKTKLLLAACAKHNSLSANFPLKLSTWQVLALPSKSAAELCSAEAPHMVLIGEIPWLANEVFTICQPRPAEISEAVNTKHWNMYRELFHDADPPEAQAMDADL